MVKRQRYRLQQPLRPLHPSMLLHVQLAPFKRAALAVAYITAISTAIARGLLQTTSD